MPNEVFGWLLVIYLAGMFISLTIAVIASSTSRYVAFALRDIEAILIIAGIVWPVYWMIIASSIRHNVRYGENWRGDEVDA